MSDKTDSYHANETNTKHQKDRFIKFAKSFEEPLRKHLKSKNIKTYNRNDAKKTETLFFQLMTDHLRKILSPSDFPFIHSISIIYNIMPREYVNDSTYAEDRRKFQAEVIAFLDKEKPKIGLQDIETDIFKIIGFRDVISKEEFDRIDEKIRHCPEPHIKSINISLLEALFRLAPLLRTRVPDHSNNADMIDDIKIINKSRLIAIKASYSDDRDKNRLLRFRDLVDRELKSLHKFFGDDYIAIKKVSLFPRAKEKLVSIEKGLLIAQEREINKIIRFSEARQISILSGMKGVGKSLILREGVMQQLGNKNAKVAYCKIDDAFRQKMLSTLDELFPDTRADDLHSQMETLALEDDIIVFILDKFERIFSKEDSEKLQMEVMNFIRNFEKLGRTNEKWRLIISIDEHFLGELYSLSADTSNFCNDKSTYYLKNLETENARKLMIKTIESLDLPVDEKLLEAILEDLNEKEISIYPPLVQTLFTQLIERHKTKYLFQSEENPFTLDFYKDEGRAAGILLEDAEKKLESFSEENKTVIIKIIQALDTPFPDKLRISGQAIVELNDQGVDTEKLIEGLLELRFVKRINTPNGYEYELVHEYLTGLIPSTSSHTGFDNKSTLVQEAVAYINANYYKPISLNDVARHVGVSGEHLSRTLKSSLKKGFKDFLIEKRIEEAKQLLIRYPKLSISDLSQKTGFSSSSHFNNVFKSETSYTPLKFRQMWQQQSNSADMSYMTDH